MAGVATQLEQPVDTGIVCRACETPIEVKLDGVELMFDPELPRDGRATVNVGFTFQRLLVLCDCDWREVPDAAIG